MLFHPIILTISSWQRDLPGAVQVSGIVARETWAKDDTTHLRQHPAATSWQHKQSKHIVKTGNTWQMYGGEHHLQKEKKSHKKLEIQSQEATKGMWAPLCINKCLHKLSNTILYQNIFCQLYSDYSNQVIKMHNEIQTFRQFKSKGLKCAESLNPTELIMMDF